MIYRMDVLAGNGVPFGVLAIPAPDEGPNKFRKPKNHTHAIVEFYDLRYPESARPGEPGQFTCGYYHIDTMLGRGRFDQPRVVGQALDLHGGVDSWTIDGEVMDMIFEWLWVLDDRDALS